MAHVLCYDGYQELSVVKLAAVAAIQSSVVRIFAPDQLLYARVVLLGCTGVRRSSLISFCPSGVAPGGAVYGSIHLSMRSCDSPSCCAGFILTAPEDSASANQHDMIDEAERGAAQNATKAFGCTKNGSPFGFRISEISGVSFSLYDSYNEAQRRRNR